MQMATGNDDNNNKNMMFTVLQETEGHKKRKSESGHCNKRRTSRSYIITGKTIKE